MHLLPTCTQAAQQMLHQIQNQADSYLLKFILTTQMNIFSTMYACLFSKIITSCIPLSVHFYSLHRHRHTHTHTHPSHTYKKSIFFSLQSLQLRVTCLHNLLEEIHNQLGTVLIHFTRMNLD